MVLNQIQNFLEPDMLESLRKKFQQAAGQPAFEVNYMGRWGAGLEKGNYAPVLILHLNEYRDYFKHKFRNLDPQFADYPNLICYMHVWLPGSQINWHNDSSEAHTRISATIYINEHWERNWGGLFLYDDPRIGKGWIFPEPNSCVWFCPPVWHATSMVSSAADHPRLSVQLFFNKS